MKLFPALFGRPKSQDKGLNQLIFDIAEYGREEDRTEIFRRLSQLELFAAVSSANFEFQNGRKLRTEMGVEVKIDTPLVYDRLLRFLVNKDDPRLGEKLISMRVADVSDMIEAGDQLGSFVFYNDKVSFFGLMREDFQELRSHYLHQH